MSWSPIIPSPPSCIHTKDDFKLAGQVRVELTSPAVTAQCNTVIRPTNIPKLREAQILILDLSLSSL